MNGRRVSAGTAHSSRSSARSKMRVVAPVLDDTAGMRHRRAIAVEQRARLGERQPAADVRQVHRDLARQRHLRAPARRPPQILVGDTEDLNDGVLDGLARRQSAGSAPPCSHCDRPTWLR